jgi:hypothetical protein
VYAIEKNAMRLMPLRFALLPDFCLWHKTDIESPPLNVRFGRTADISSFIYEDAR